MNDLHKTVAASAGYGLAAVIVLNWVMQLCTGKSIPAEVQPSLAMLISGLIGYFFHQQTGDGQ